MARPVWNDQRAFSLLEIIAALGIVAVIFLFINQMSRSLKSQSELVETRSHMETIIEKAKAYYVQRGDLPRVSVVNGIPGIPLGTGGLDLDPKLRFDGWHQPLRYISYTNDGDPTAVRPGRILIDPTEQSPPYPSEIDKPAIEIPVDTRTLLRAIQFEGRQVAGLVISSGPNQVFEILDAVVPAYPEVYTLPPGSDDIIMVIDLTREATRMAQAELKILNEKVAAFEDRYLGIDNDGNNEYDDGGCVGIPYGYNSPFVLPPNFTNCNQLRIPGRFTVYPPGTVIDINCGKPTLDYMKAHFCAYPFGAPGCPPGYYLPELADVGPIPNPAPPFDPPVCPQTPRIGSPAGPAVLGTGLNTCYWGRVRTLPVAAGAGALVSNDTDGDQARAFISCLFNLRPEDVVDPWLNGYVWGCGDHQTHDAEGGTYSGCLYTYPVGDPHYHRFFSAGPDGLPAAIEPLSPTDEPGTDDIIN
jgi:prepilin-type N-terminal cleavage/methylation domain-containing protein